MKSYNIQYWIIWKAFIYQKPTNKHKTVHYFINWQQCSEYFDYKSEILV